jgi:hypothetical protein
MRYIRHLTIDLRSNVISNCIIYGQFLEESSQTILLNFRKRVLLFDLTIFQLYHDVILHFE